MKKILISLCNETINFRYKVDKTKDEKDLTKTLMNTNVICNDELIFSDTYLKNNIGIMSSFLGELVKEKNVYKLVIEEFDIIPIVLEITNQIKNITNLYITPDIIISYKIYEKLVNANYLKYVNCFEIPTFMLEKLCDNNMIVDLRCEIISISNFVHQNNLVNYTKLYYRKTIKIFTKLSKDDLNDFETFCQINRNLKNIYIYDFDIDMINNIYNILIKTNKKNIRLLVHQNLENTKIIDNSIKELKIINKKLIKNCDSKIKIVYSVDYISKNFIKQLSITNLKTCLLIILFLEIIILVGIKINNYKTDKNLEKIQDVAADLTYYFDDLNEIQNETVADNQTETNNTNGQLPETSVVTAYNTKYEQSFDTLKGINSDTKAWLSLNNTSINFPVVQATNNDYYLNHDFNKDSNANGWVFIDYRNNLDILDQNTIIYGHNTKSNTMFATLKYSLKESWYKNEENQLIIFNTPDKQMKFKIFSVYVIDNTNDYLNINFSDNDFINFINLIKDRSIYNFGVDLTKDDKIITLSTCSDRGNKRLVVHGKLQ